MRPEAELDVDATAKRKRPIVLHYVAHEQLAAEFPEFTPGRALCGFIFRARNAVTMAERATEGESQCGRCEALYLEVLLALS